MKYYLHNQSQGKFIFHSEYISRSTHTIINTIMQLNWYCWRVGGEVGRNATIHFAARNVRLTIATRKYYRETTHKPFVYEWN